MRDVDELLQAYQGGDAEAEAELLERAEVLLRRLVRRQIGYGIRSDRDSADVCQSLLLAFHEQARSGKVDFENEAALVGFLRTVVRNKMVNLSERIRAAKRGGGVSRVSLDVVAAHLPALGPSASEVAGTDELFERIDAVLSPEEQAILRGRLAGRTNREIGETLGKSPDAVRMLWNRAKDKLSSVKR